MVSLICLVILIRNLGEIATDSQIKLMKILLQKSVGSEA